MSAVAKDDFRSFHYLIALGGVAVVTVAVFFGVAFLWLAPPHPTAPPPDPVPPRQALDAHEVPPLEASDTVRGSSVRSLEDATAPSPIPTAPPNREALALRSAPIETMRSPPAPVAHAKRARAGRHTQNRTTISRLPKREAERSALGFAPTGRNWNALWRADDPPALISRGTVKGSRCFEVMDRASDYRERATHLRRLAELTWQDDLEALLRHVARDYDEVAEDLEAGTTEIRHAELIRE
jgi:hypothetical protein